jgi:hypothetical protein
MVLHFLIQTIILTPLIFISLLSRRGWTATATVTDRIHVASLLPPIPHLCIHSFLSLS